MPDKPVGTPIPRPKHRIAGRPVARAKKILPTAEVAEPVEADKQIGSAQALESTIEKITRIPRRKSDAVLDAELQGLGPQLNNIREDLDKGKRELRSARGWLNEPRDNVPPTRVSISRSPSLAELDDALRSARDWLQKHRNNAPPSKRPVPRTRVNTNKRNLALALIAGSLDVIGEKNNRLDLESHAKLVANQKLIVSEFEQKVEALEKQDREINAQIKDKAREIEMRNSEN